MDEIGKVDNGSLEDLWGRGGSEDLGNLWACRVFGRVGAWEGQGGKGPGDLGGLEA